MGHDTAFVAFGAAHVTTLAAVAGLALSLVTLVRRQPRLAGVVRVSLAAAIVGLVAFELAQGAREGWLEWHHLLPLELCDAALVLAVAALLRPRVALAEIAYFWAASGSVLAMLTPELPWGFPRWEYLVFFGLHGLALVAALVLVFGMRLRPRPRAPLRVFAITAGWTAAVGLLDLALGANYMYLCRKPSVPTLLDSMGPWPVYIGVAALLALVSFAVLALPFRHDRDAMEVTPWTR